MRRITGATMLMASLIGGAGDADAGVIFNMVGNTIGGGSRWDAAPRVINGAERSLAGGLRYSVQGGSFQAFRDLFTWQGGAPSLAAFTQAVTAAFDAWTVVDPTSGLGTTLSFVADLATNVVGTGAGGVNAAGAEIDLFGSIDARSWNPGSSGTQGETYFQTIGSAVALTSGTASYAGSTAISGADITLNSNPQAVYTLDLFRRLLSHEIGHAIGLGDVEGDLNPGAFLDDNFNGSTAATTVATLTNSWAGLVNPLNPAASPLQRYTVPYANPGTLTPGVDILMESRGLGISNSNPVTRLAPLTNDDFGTRQFLYPSLVAAAVPEPSTWVMTGTAALLGLACSRRRRTAA